MIRKRKNSEPYDILAVSGALKLPIHLGMNGLSGPKKTSPLAYQSHGEHNPRLVGRSFTAEYRKRG